MSQSTIEWCDEGWPIVTGCSHCASGCLHCYAARLASTRLRHLPQYAGLAVDGRWTGEVRCHPELLDEPLRWRKPRRVFVAPTGDLFHERVDFGFATHVFDVFDRCPQHSFMVLTKRPARLLQFLRGKPLDHGWQYTGRGVLPNAWLGTSASTQADLDRGVPHLLRCPAAVRWLSLEPLLESVELCSWFRPVHSDSLGAPCQANGDPWIETGLDWVVVGAETGPNRRPCHYEAVVSVVNQCRAAGVPVFVKAVEIGAKIVRKFEQFPTEVRVREYPVGRSFKRGGRG